MVFVEYLITITKLSTFQCVFFLYQTSFVNMLGSQVTPWTSPCPPTARTGCSWPSGQLEATWHYPEWFPVPKKTRLKKTKSLSCLEAKLLPNVLLDLLQLVEAVHDLEVNWRQLDIVPNDSLCPKKLGLKKNQVSIVLGSRVTPQCSPWPPTACRGRSWPSDQS